MLMEIHDSLSPIYSQFYFNNTYQAIIGLSAKINTTIGYVLDDEKVITKGDYLNKIAPICFSYQLKTSIENNTSRELKVHIIYNQLDAYNPYIKAGSKKKPFFQSEYANYKYWDKKFDECAFIADNNLREVMYLTSSNKRKLLLFNLKTKVNITKTLLKYLKNKTIVFGNSLDFLFNITNNVVCNRNTDERNTQIRENFELGTINVIGSFKKLKQGANLSDDLDNCIITSYYSSEVDLEQRIGRLRDNGTTGNVFIIVTKNTQEQKWFNIMIKDIQKSLTLIHHEDVHDCVKYLTENEEITN